MGDMAELWNAWKKHWRVKRNKNLQNAKPMIKALGFTKHTEYHYSLRDVGGGRLDYWPSRNKWRWKNKNYHGVADDLVNFIDARQEWR